MPENMPPIGAIGQNVIDAVAELRQARGLSLRGLSALLGDLGRPVLPIGLSRLENGQRKVDAADLVALAVALGVNPSALLLPRHVAADEVVELTPAVRQRAALAWAWMDGRLPLPPELIAEGTNVVVTPGDRFADFMRHARPDAAQDPDPAMTELLTLRQMIEDVLSDPERWQHWRDAILRRFRLVAIQLEELFARLDREAFAAEAFQFDTGAAVEQLRVATQQVRQAAVGFAPGTAERYREGARADRQPGPHGAETNTVDPLDPFGKRDGR